MNLWRDRMIRHSLWIVTFTFAWLMGVDVCLMLSLVVFRGLKDHRDQKARRVRKASRASLAVVEARSCLARCRHA